MAYKNKEAQEVKSSELKENSYEDFLNEVNSKVEKYKSDFQPFYDRMSEKYKRRFGLREDKSFPFPNCANYSMRLSDKLIKKLKPHYYSLVAGRNGERADVIYNSVDDKVLAENTRSALNYILTYGIEDYEPTLWRAIDKMMMFDYCILHPYWKYCTEERDIQINIQELGLDNIDYRLDFSNQEMLMYLFGAVTELTGIEFYYDDEDDMREILKVAKAIDDGKEEVTITVDEVVSDNNAIDVVDPRLFIFEPSVDRIEDSELVCERMRFTKRELVEAMNSGKFSKSICESVIEKGGNWDKNNFDTIEYERSERDGVLNSQTRDEDFYEIRKVYMYVETSKERYRRACIYYSENDMSAPLSFQWYDRKDWPYVQFYMEVTEGEALKVRGVVTLMDTFEKIINNQLNNMLDRRIMTTCPMTTHIPTKIYSGKIRFVPGESIPVKDHNAVKPLQVGSNADIVFERGILFIRAWAEEFIGVPDFAITDPGTSSAGSDNARTATEMRMVAGMKDMSMSLDAKIFNNCMEKLYRNLILDWIEYATETIRMDVEGREITLDKKDILMNPKFKAVTVFASDREIKKQQFLEFYMLALNDPAGAQFFDQYKIRQMVAEAFEDEGGLDILLDKQIVKQNLQAQAQMRQMEEQENNVRAANTEQV